jgi:hypothetical protein
MFMQQDCIREIDYNYVNARVLRGHYHAYMRRKQYTSQNMLAAVNFDMKFTYMLAGWEGSSHDTSNFAHGMIRPDGLKINEGMFYLVDAGYACRHVILPHVRSTIYHLNEFFARHYTQGRQGTFYPTHSNLRVTIKRGFTAL